MKKLFLISLIVYSSLLWGCYNDCESLKKQVTLLEVGYLIDHQPCLEGSKRCDGNKIAQYCHAGGWHNSQLCYQSNDYCVPAFGECNSILTAP